jgi:hypothetical protein
MVPPFHFLSAECISYYVGAVIAPLRAPSTLQPLNVGTSTTWQ